MSEHEEHVSQILFADIRVFTQDRISCNPDLMPRISCVCVTVSRASPLISFLTPTSFAVVAAVTGLLVGFHLPGYFFPAKKIKNTLYHLNAVAADESCLAKVVIKVLYDSCVNPFMKS